MNEEMNSLIEINTFTLCTLSRAKIQWGTGGGGWGVSLGIHYERKLYWC